MDRSLDSNDRSTQRCYDIYEEVVAALKVCLHQENIPFEEKQYYIEKMMEVAKMSEKRDTENKHFNWGIIAGGAAAVVAGLSIAASVLGVNIHIPHNKS